MNKYVTKLRKREINNNVFVNLNTQDQNMQMLPNIAAYVWDEIHGPNGPPGWDPAMYWPWENVRLLLMFIPAHMKADRMRAVVLMYKSMTMNLPTTNNMGFRLPTLSRLKGWCCGPSDRSDSCPIEERLAGACSHSSTAIYIAGILSHNPNAFSSSHRVMHLIDRANIQAANQEVAAEVLA